jgi:hypothetical protein
VLSQRNMVDVAQLVEPRIVIPVVVGSIPIVHPIFQGKEYRGKIQGGGLSFALLSLHFRS